MGARTPSDRGVPVFTGRQVQTILERMGDNKPVRRSLGAWGRLHMDRKLPFLCVYRRPPERPDPGTERLCVAEAAYLLAPGDATAAPGIRDLLRPLCQAMVERFGAFLLLEIWSTPTLEPQPPDQAPREGFVIHTLRHEDLDQTVRVLTKYLLAMKGSRRPPDVGGRTHRRPSVPELRPLFSPAELDELGVYWIGLEVKPIYIDPTTGEVYPLLLRALRRQLGHVLDRTFYTFAHEHTTHLPRDYQTLGRRAMVKAVWDIDRRLAAVSNSFDFLYQVTPVNADRAWQQFHRSRCQRAPVFQYRPQAVDPGRMKRVLYDIPIDRVEDPTLLHLFLDKQMELDRQLTMLYDLGTPAFLYGSFQLHGTVRPKLLETAREILAHTPPRSRSDTRGDDLTAAQFAARARREINWYRRHVPGFEAAARVTDELYAGLLVSHGRLLVGKETRIPARRAEALIQHEVGTHLLTYFNGRAQPFKMLSSGLPGYDELQEGLAVLAEYLVGGLTPPRLRVLAARVVAAHALADGASFVEVFRLLSRTHGFTQRAAYTISMRVFRGGGLMKDAVYLRGLVGILKFLGNGGALEPLFLGKIAASHVPVIEELLHRRILTPTPALPRYLETPDAQARLTALRQGLTVMQLLPKPRRRKT